MTSDAGRSQSHADDCHRREGGTYCDCGAGRSQSVDDYVTERLNAVEGEASVEQIKAWEAEAVGRSRTVGPWWRKAPDFCPFCGFDLRREGLRWVRWDSIRRCLELPDAASPAPCSPWSSCTCDDRDCHASDSASRQTP